MSSWTSFGLTWQLATLSNLYKLRGASHKQSWVLFKITKENGWSWCETDKSSFQIYIYLVIWSHETEITHYPMDSTNPIHRSCINILIIGHSRSWFYFSFHSHSLWYDGKIQRGIWYEDKNKEDSWWKQFHWCFTSLNLSTLAAERFQPNIDFT